MLHRCITQRISTFLVPIFIYFTFFEISYKKICEGEKFTEEVISPSPQKVPLQTLFFCLFYNPI